VIIRPTIDAAIGFIKAKYAPAVGPSQTNELIGTVSGIPGGICDAAITSELGQWKGPYGSPPPPPPLYGVNPDFHFPSVLTNVVRASRAIDRRRFGLDRGR